MAEATRSPVGAGSAAIAMVDSPPSSRGEPAPTRSAPSRRSRFTGLPRPAPRESLVGFVVDTDIEHHLAGRLAVVVGDDAVGQVAVGHDHRLVVTGAQHSVEDLDAVHGTADTLRLDPVAQAERTEQQDQHAAGEVRQAALQGQADGQAGSTDGGDERGGFHADHRGHADEQQDLHDDVDEGADEALQRQVGIAQGQELAQFRGDLVDQPPADGQGNQRQGQATAVFHDQRNPGLRSPDQLIDLCIQIHVPSKVRLKQKIGGRKRFSDPRNLGRHQNAKVPGPAPSVAEIVELQRQVEFLGTQGGDAFLQALGVDLALDQGQAQDVQHRLELEFRLGGHQYGLFLFLELEGALALQVVAAIQFLDGVVHRVLDFVLVQFRYHVERRHTLLQKNKRCAGASVQGSAMERTGV
ncbi:hypothetical protein L1887_60074 [Cichorium endivia]|nr:hypothetical protein L1887_60074 [Cichorium endivia]